MFTSPNVDVQVDRFPKSPNRQMPAVKKSLWLQINGSSEQKLRFEPSIFVDISWVYQQRGTKRFIRILHMLNDKMDGDFSSNISKFMCFSPTLCFFLCYE